jgi:hypothetical protein
MSFLRVRLSLKLQINYSNKNNYFSVNLILVKSNNPTIKIIDSVT